MYINTNTNQYPVSESEIRAEFSNTSFPAPFAAPQPYQVVFSSPQPSHDPVTHGVREVAPELTDKGHWEKRWEVYAFDAEVVAANQAAAALRLQDEVVSSTQKRLDEFAKTRNFDGILSACTYASSTVLKFQREGQYCVEARDQTWAKLYEILAEVEAGTRPIPTGFSDIEPSLPALVWPA
jgi:hypothetical protein